MVQLLKVRDPVHPPSGGYHAHGRAIGASHARLARRWVSRLKRQIRCPLSELRTTLAQLLCQSGIGRQPRRLLLLLQTT